MTTIKEDEHFTALKEEILEDCCLFDRNDGYLGTGVIT